MSEWKSKGSGESDEWYTPKYIFDALGEEFDLDVACPPEGPRYTPAKSFFSEDGLGKEWSGFVWMNPPYGHQNTKRKWLRKFSRHGNGIALVPDRTSAPWFHEMLTWLPCALIVSGKIKFEKPDGSIGEQPGNGTWLLGTGLRAQNALRRAAKRRLGFYLELDEVEYNNSPDVKDD